MQRENSVWDIHTVHCRAEGNQAGTDIFLSIQGIISCRASSTTHAACRWASAGERGGDVNAVFLMRGGGVGARKHLHVIDYSFQHLLCPEFWQKRLCLRMYLW